MNFINKDYGDMRSLRIGTILALIIASTVFAQLESFGVEESKGNIGCCREDRGKIVRRFPKEQPFFVDPDGPGCKCRLQKSSFEWVAPTIYMLTLRSNANGCDNPLTIYDNGTKLLNTCDGTKWIDIRFAPGYHLIRMNVQGCLEDDTVNVSVTGTSCPNGTAPINCFKLGPHMVCFCNLLV